MNDIIFEKQQGGLSRTLPGEDHYSALLFYSATKPSGYGTDSIKQITSIEHAVTLGIAEGSANYGVMWYHISEFFRINSGGVLFVGIFTSPEVGYSEIKTLARFAAGKLRQVGLYVTDAFDDGMVTLIQGVLDDLEEEHMPMIALLAADFHAVSDLTTLPDIRTLDSPKVSVVFGQDGGAAGKALYTSKSKSITCLGAALGAVSLAAVNENIGWVQKFKMSEVELDVPAFANGTLVETSDPNLLDSINTKGYIFLRKHVGKSGSYFNDSHSCVEATSDYAYIENNRTMDKAIRGIRTYLLPQLNGPLLVDPDSGKLDIGTIKFYEALANEPLIQMARDGELSGYKASIDPDQNVLSTSELVIRVVNVPVGVARIIKVKIGFGLKV